MNGFEVEISPPLPSVPDGKCIMSIQDMDLGKIYESFPQEYFIKYHVNDLTYCYYPSSIVTIINDIFWELDLIKERKTHEMTLSGYCVLEMVFENEQVLFFDPVERTKNALASSIADPFAIEAVEKQFKMAANSLSHLVRSVGGLRADRS